MAETCIACGKPFKNGDRYLPDISGGNIHFDGLGPDPECFIDMESGEPLAERPEPLIWEANDGLIDLTQAAADLQEARGSTEALAVWAALNGERLLSAARQHAEPQGEPEPVAPDGLPFQPTEVMIEAGRAVVFSDRMGTPRLPKADVAINVWQAMFLAARSAKPVATSPSAGEK